MGEKVLEVVIYLIRHIEENDGRFDGLKDMADDLRGQGFTDNEINSAYLWILDQYQQPECVARFTKDTKGTYCRVLSDYERGYLTTEAQGALIQMRHLGIIDDTQFELIVEKVIVGGQDKVDDVAVRSMAWSFVANRTPNDQSNLDINVFGYDEDLQIH